MITNKHISHIAQVGVVVFNLVFELSITIVMGAIHLDLKVVIG